MSRPTAHFARALLRRAPALPLACLLAAGCHSDTRSVVLDCGGPHAAPADTLPVPQAGDGWEGVLFDAARGRQARWFLGRPEQATWSPTRADVERVEARLEAELERARRDPGRVDAHAAGSASRRAFLAASIERVIAQLPHYRRQYVGLVGSDGRRRLLVNAFPGPRWPLGTSFDFGRWREELVSVSDGGFWFWHAEFDADSGRLLRLAPNGDA